MENAGRATRRRKRLKLQESKKLMKEAYEASTLRRGRATHVKVARRSKTKRVRGS